ncbi:MAG: hypothetical protein P0S96_04555 [Simkaniaceae bacterium]|nr:hypothetical protein [Candidatus Sacchlamyda saccharinae]
MALFFGVERFCRLQTDGFRLTKALCQHSYPFSYSYGKPLNLDQPFYFLGSGVQFYAFLGEDKQTILKLFKHHHMGLSTDLCEKLLPKSFASSIMAKREKRMHHIFTSTKIAASRLPRETGTVFLHIDKKPMGLGKITIHDKLGISYEVDLDKTDFLLQKRAVPASTYLKKLFKKGATDEAIFAMQAMKHLIEKRSRMGIKNKDGNILENCGFLEGEPVELDIGSFIYREHSTNPDPHSKATFRATLQMLGWVKKNHPEYLHKCTAELLHEKTF